MLRKTLMGGLVLSISMLVACGDDDSFVPKPTGLPDCRMKSLTWINSKHTNVATRLLANGSM